jgi:hypothetical protein
VVQPVKSGKIPMLFCTMGKMVVRWNRQLPLRGAFNQTDELWFTGFPGGQEGLPTAHILALHRTISKNPLNQRSWLRLPIPQEEPMQQHPELLLPKYLQ